MSHRIPADPRDERQFPPNTRRIDIIEPGYFRVKLCRGGPYVPGRIDLTAHGWQAWINGESCGFANQNPDLADGVNRIWHWGTPITKAEHDKMLPHSSPTKRVDWATERTPF